LIEQLANWQHSDKIGPMVR